MRILVRLPLSCAHDKVLYCGIPDGEMKEWAGRGVGHDMGVDWRET